MAVVFILVSGGTCFGVFGGRLKNLSDAMEQQEKVQEDKNWKGNQTYDKHYEEDKHNDHHDVKKISE